MKAAFYKGTRPGIAGLYNRLGRALDHGPYSHMELVFSDGVSASSSFMDHGVRFKQIGYSSEGCWDFMVLPDHLEAGARRYFEEHDGWGYDVWGNIHFAFGVVRDSRHKKFCSESCGDALTWREAWRYAPSGWALAAADRYGTLFTATPWHGDREAVPTPAFLCQ